MLLLVVLRLFLVCYCYYCYYYLFGINFVITNYTLEIFNTHSTFLWQEFLRKILKELPTNFLKWLYSKLMFCIVVWLLKSEKYFIMLVHLVHLLNLHTFLRLLSALRLLCQLFNFCFFVSQFWNTCLVKCNNLILDTKFL